MFTAAAGAMAWLLGTALQAQQPLPGVPAPREHFGFEIGEHRRLADWRELTAYYERLARTSPRVRVDTLGTSTRGLPFVMLTITSEANHARLEELRTIQQRLADPRRIGSPAELEELLQRGRTVVLITHAIHSTEVGSAQTAARLAWRLAAGTDEATREILDNVVLLQIPSLNPDGTQWVADWHRQTVGTAYEGSAPPWLYHWYVGHDNNRDWYAFTQRETQLAIEHAHNAWRPQVVHDIHQMGTTGARLFVPPYIDPYERNVDPAIIAGVNQLGTWMAASLTASGRAGVVTNAIFDAFTPARAYQHYHGGVRILSETASARGASPIEVAAESLRGSRGYDARTPSSNFPLPWPGGTWGLPDIVDTMESAAVALLENAARNRRYWLESFHGVMQRATARWPAWPTAWVIPDGQANTAGVQYMLRVLTLGDVEVRRARAPFTAAGRSFPAGSWVVPMNQPFASFAQAMLEVQEYPDLREYPGGPPLRPYDVTAHTLPLLFGVEAVPVAAWTDAAPALSEPIPAVRDFAFRLPASLHGAGAPRIAIYKGWTETMPAGWTRWLFDQHGLAYDTLKDERVRAGGLGRDYDVILFQAQAPASIVRGNAEGTLPPEYTGGIGDDGVAALREFVQGGGRIVAIEQATELVIEMLGLDVRNAVGGLRPQEFYVPGSILRAGLVQGHALTAGLGTAADVWYGSSSRAFEARDPRVTVAAHFAEGDPRISGWILGPQHLAGRPALVEARVGNGSVVLFGFQPNYRAQTVATWPLLFNALSVPRRQH